jgi:hypothetical protein
MRSHDQLRARHTNSSAALPVNVGFVGETLPFVDGMATPDSGAGG